MNFRQALRFYLELLRPQRKLLLFAVIFACAKAALESPLPKLTGWVIDRFAKNDLQWLTAHLWLVIAGLAGYALVYLPVTYGRGYFPQMVAMRAFFWLRVRLFNHIQGLGADFYLRNKTGDLTARLITDIQTASATAVTAITRVAFDLFIFVPSLYFLIRISLPLTLGILAYAMVQLFFVRQMMPEVHRRSKQVSDQMGQISSEATEKLAGFELVKSMARESEVTSQFESLNARHLYLSTRLMTYSWKRNVLISGLNEFMPVILALVALPLVRRGHISPGDVVAVILYLPVVTGPLFRFSDALAQWAQAQGAMTRVKEVFDTLPLVRDKPQARDLGNVAGRIAFSDVHFAYPAMEHSAPRIPVITGFSLEVAAGEAIALVGHSGSGKTTLTQLLLRFYDVQQGAIAIDGQDIRDVTQLSLRRTIGIVMQNSIIFSGSIRDNLRFVKPDADDAQILEALRLAQLQSFIASLPDGLNTVLGERGINLSGGQKQRLSIARIFLKNPAILILDEATSALDAQSEAALQEALEQLMRNRTTLIIAHRLSTVRNADRIVVLGEGRIQEIGSHADLLARRGPYFNLVRAQADLIA